jgi:hypothetical protein
MTTENTPTATPSPSAAPATERCPDPACPMCSGEACATCGPGLATDVTLGWRPPCEHDAVGRHPAPSPSPGATPRCEKPPSACEPFVGTEPCDRCAPSPGATAPLTDLGALEALAEAATPGEWDWAPAHAVSAGRREALLSEARVFVVAGGTSRDLATVGIHRKDEADANARFIAAARAAVPALITELRSLRRLRADEEGRGATGARPYTVRICDQCMRLEGEMCHRPECVFCRRTMREVGEYLDALLIRPVIDGVRMDAPSPSLPDAPLPDGRDATREERLTKGLRAVEAHHAGMCRAVGRPETNSTTLRIVRSALVGCDCLAGDVCPRCQPSLPTCARHPGQPVRRFGPIWRCSECGEDATLLPAPRATDDNGKETSR